MKKSLLSDNPRVRGNPSQDHAPTSYTGIYTGSLGMAPFSGGKGQRSVTLLPHCYLASYLQTLGDILSLC